jgi:hypothetical protein
LNIGIVGILGGEKGCVLMEVQSGWKWNEWRKALSVLTILHEERRKREERRERAIIHGGSITW